VLDGSGEQLLQSRRVLMYVVLLATMVRSPFRGNERFVRD
jgi:hypothetical protein